MTSLSVRDFKSLKQISIELGQVNVLVGANGAGKSNLLEAIGVIGAAASGRIDDQALLRRGVRPGVPEVYKSAFADTPIAQAIEIKIENGDGASYRINITNPSDEPKPWWVFHHEEILHAKTKIASRSPAGTRLQGEKIKLENRASVGAMVRASLGAPASVRAVLDALDDYAVFSPVTPVLRGIAQDTAQRNPVGLFGGQLPEAIAMLLAGDGSKQRKVLLEEAVALVDWAEAFDIVEPSRQFISPSVPTTRQVIQFVDRFMRADRNHLSGYDASEGALYILFMLVLALHAQAPPIFAVDNFDHALNPRTARGLTRVFTDAILARGRQAILTTHNPLVLDGLPLDDERVRLFTVARDDRGYSQVKPVPIRDLAKLKHDHGDDAVSQLWLSGRLGGMPNV